ncbi:hypothetical protein L1987_29667 [Smallanthus sonchifolius]|uniref:Uncharacterized protein n=1 Tax=Smallanthus sonchifolius TaxID=185202 RepID=A0ACB9I0Q6_9ASTR|nr:hypothetical protein L1987_29667 [Smallanthus sonchifolius]
MAMAGGGHGPTVVVVVIYVTDDNDDDEVVLSDFDGDGSCRQRATFDETQRRRPRWWQWGLACQLKDFILDIDIW